MTTLASGLSAAEVLAKVRELPPLPQALRALQQSLGDESAGAGRLARGLALDPALATKTLRLANSSIYGLSRQVHSLADAVAVLGVHNLRTMATAVGVVASFSALQCPGFEFRAFWRHSIGVAICARSLARQQSLDEDTAFTLGLMHDVGRLALAASFPAEMAHALEHQRATDALPLDAERAVLGIDHAAVGAMLADHWRFAPALGLAIAGHHEPPRSPHACLSDVLHVADNIAHALDLSGLEHDSVPPLSMAAWLRLNLDDARCRAVFGEAEREHEAVCAALLT